MKLLLETLGVVLTCTAYVLLLWTIWSSIRVAWRQRQSRHLDIVFVVAAPVHVFLIRAATLGSLGDVLKFALLVAQPYFLLRLVRRFRDVPRAIYWTVAAVAIVSLGLGLWAKVTVAGLPLFVSAALSATYPAAAFLTEARRNAGVTRMRLLFASAATAMLVVSFFLAILPGLVKLFATISPGATDYLEEYSLSLSSFSYRSMLVCYFFAFSPPRRLAARWQRTQQAKFLSDTIARDPEERGKLAASDLDGVIRHSMSSSAVIIALRSTPTADDLTVRAASNGPLTGTPITPDERRLIGIAIQTGEAVSGKPEQFESELASQFRSPQAGVLVAPIRTATQTWGAVAVVQRGSLFPEDDLRLLAQFGRYTGTALDHAHLFVEARERERRLADRRVHAVEAQMGLTLDSIKDYAMFVLDREGRVATWHVGAEQIFGYVAGEMTGKPAASLFTLTTAELSALVEQAFRVGHARREGPCSREDGTRFIGATTLRLHEDGPDDRSGIVTVTKDVTEQRELESRLRQSQKMEAIGQLAGGIAHDFNNLLVAILGNADYLANALKDDDERIQEVGEIQKAAERAAALTTQLLAFTRRRMIEPRAIDLVRLVGDLLPMLRRMIGEHVEIFQQQAGERSTIMGDRSQVEQIILNLAVNARDAMPTGGRLEIRTSTQWLDATMAAGDLLPGPYVQLEVRDNGVGMDATTQTRIFEPFFTTKEFGGGTGLGLATVYGIVRQMGGAVRVESEPNKGTAFRLYFPETRDREVIARSQAHADAPRGTETVLLVEDDEAVSRFLAGTLRRHGYQVLVAAHPSAAVAVVKNHAGPIHLAITDIVLPGGTGLDLVHNLTDIRPGLPALYISGYADGALSEEATFPKASLFLQKPFSAADLLSRVRQILSVPDRT
jgi:PAS domain S-box-containing protein